MNRERPNDPKKEFNPEPPAPINEELAQRILGSMKKAYTGEETVRWLANMSQELPVEPIAPSKSNPKTQWLNLRAVSLLDKLFDDFQRYTFEFNKTITDPECRVNCERPKPMHVNLGRGEEPIICQGHLSTAIYGMVLQAQEHTVSAFIIPVDFLLGFNSARDKYKPYLVMQAETENGMQTWRIKGTPLNAEVLSTFTKKVFAALIRVLNGEAELDESFEFDSTKHVPTSTMDFGKQQQQPQRPGYAEEFELQRDEQAPALASANPAPAAANPMTSTGRNKITREAQKANVASAPAASPAAPAYEAAPAYSAPPAPESAPAPSYGSAPAPFPAPAAAAAAPGAADQRLVQNGQSVEAAINTFGRLIDQELDALTNLGVKAMQAQDIVFVQKTIKRQAALKAFREKTIAFAQEWHSAMRD
jgi:hypothetical protein